MAPIKVWDHDDEELPRNAAAIRTAIMLGAKFYQTPAGQWTCEGIDMKSHNCTMPAWMYLLTHGLGIDKNAVPKLLKDIPNEPGRIGAMHALGKIVEKKG